MAKLSNEQVRVALKTLSGWKQDGDYITKAFKFGKFMEGINFVEEVARIAEEQEHHPDIHIVWTTVTLKIQTHDEGGITEWDVGLAREIENHFSTGNKTTTKKKEKKKDKKTRE